MMDDLQDRMTRFQAHLQVLTAHYAEEAAEEWKEFREEAREKIVKLKDKTGDWQQVAGEEWKEWRGEINKAFSNLSSAFKRDKK